MKISGIWGFRSIVGKISMGLVVAAMIGSVDVAPSFGGDNHGFGGGRSEQRGPGHGGGRNEQRGRGSDRGHYGHGRREYRSYGYRERVYYPPPVVYAPPPPAGIGIFLPSIIIHP